MVVSILAVKNKPSKRGGKRVRSNTAIPLKNTKTRGSRPVIECIPLIAIFFPTDKLTDYFSPRNYARDA